MDAHFTKILSQPLQSNGHDRKSFIPSKSFIGSKSGYIFQMGEYGLGYYVDKYYSFEPTSNAQQPSEVHPEASDLQVLLKIIMLTLHGCA